MIHKYAVIDFETTGLNARGHDRVVEIGLVLLRSDLSIEGTWSSVVNPERDLGPTHIHGLTGSACVHAPVFAQIAAEFLDTLDGRVLASHNWAFDSRFLSAEIARLGTEWLPDGLCTMRLAAQVGLPRSLDGATAELGIGRSSDVHGALEDAALAAEVLRSLYDEVRPEKYKPVKKPFIQVVASRSPVPREIAAPGTRRRIPRSLVPGLDEIPWPETGNTDSDALEEYCALLLDVLGDGNITKEEVDALSQARMALGLDDSQITYMHNAVFDGARRLAWADQKLLSWEKEQLEHLASQLGVKRDTTRPVQHEHAPPAKIKGQTIVFTGDHVRPRNELQRLAIRAGAEVKDAVTGKVTLLVAADPTSLSGKAKRARELGIKIISVEAFLTDVG